jgi:hypothetical protein
VIGKELNSAELEMLVAEGTRFTDDWTAHNQKLSAAFSVLENKIIIVKVNEKDYAASGCSIDKLTRFMTSIGKQFGFDPFDRMTVAYREEGSVRTAPASVLRKMASNGELKPGTRIFNTAVSREDDLNHWEIPFSQSWLAVRKSH